MPGLWNLNAAKEELHFIHTSMKVSTFIVWSAYVLLLSWWALCWLCSSDILLSWLQFFLHTLVVVLWQLLETVLMFLMYFTISFSAYLPVHKWNTLVADPTQKDTTWIGVIDIILNKHCFLRSVFEIFRFKRLLIFVIYKLLKAWIWIYNHFQVNSWLLKQ